MKQIKRIVVDLQSLKIKGGKGGWGWVEGSDCILEQVKVSQAESDMKGKTRII